MSPIAAAEAFERAPLLAERVGEGDAETLLRRARDIIAGLTEQERIAILNSHPAIGASVPLTMRSAVEQRASERTDRKVLDSLLELNRKYEERFGFRFVIYMNGRSRGEILRVFEARLRRTRDQELATGVEEFLAIARDRLTRG
ncbi:MAG: 2-oxo-4-hydroxy-4-carboxy-5-ureidoimidazoline decarboxylase [Actinobacteria bacterium]|nr:2-oxo-4-hydroxy-4-carboxy-5-ureidoimidazoline decarboxylase [Actinomycetota bacterium]